MFCLLTTLILSRGILWSKDCGKASSLALLLGRHQTQPAEQKKKFKKCFWCNPYSLVEPTATETRRKECRLPLSSTHSSS